MPSPARWLPPNQRRDQLELAQGHLERKTPWRLVKKHCKAAARRIQIRRTGLQGQ
jgi:hypothetical protein